MDYDTLLSQAEKNENKKNNRPNYYSTKFAPPKKESKPETKKNLSENIKKFLAKKEAEEQQKKEEEQRKKENLLALRNQKDKNKVSRHLKVCKSANKSVLKDAIDTENTAITMAGPSQPDEDDYGYVSQEASALHAKLMNKYSNLPPEQPLFRKESKKPMADVASTKDRVIAALKREEYEASLPHKRKKKHKETSEQWESKQPEEVEEEEIHNIISPEKVEQEKPKPKRKPPPPQPSFHELLQVAAKKMLEPIKIEPKVKQEPERLMTKKMMKEYAKEKEWREKREREKLDAERKISSMTIPKKSKTAGESSNNEHLKHQLIRNNTSKSQPLKNVSLKDQPLRNEPPKTQTLKNETLKSQSTKNEPLKGQPSQNPNRKPQKSINPSNSREPALSESKVKEEWKRVEAEKRKLEEMKKEIEERQKKLEMLEKSKQISKSNGISKPEKSEVKRKIPPSEVKSRQFPPADLKPRQFPPSDVKPRQFPPADVRPRQFPPPDVRSNRPKLKADFKKRRIYSDDEDEYDSEMDDFIDDGPQDGLEQVSKTISEIFGYDRRKYRDVEDDDIDNMESNFSQQMKEEFFSSKAGILEDLEDVRKEKIMNKRRAEIMKKKLLQKSRH